MALEAAILPLAVVPFLILMNDRDYLGDHTNKLVGNTVVVIITVMAIVLAITAVPLQLLGGG
jgi:Mn2+/Fe2+ NRAMP family transporter